MVSNHNDTIALDALLEKNMVWKLLQIAPSHSAGIVMMPLWMEFDAVDRIIKLVPKLTIQFPGNGFILRGNLSGIFRCPRVDDQSLHRT